MAQAKAGFKNPISGQHVKGGLVGAVLLAAFCFVWPGWFMMRSAANEQVERAAATAHASYAPYCVASYLAAPGRTVDDVKKMKSASHATQAKAMLEGKFAVTQGQAEACGKAIDGLSDQQMADGMKKVTAAEVKKN